MSYYEVYSKYKDFSYEEFFSTIVEEDVKKVLSKDKLNEMDYLTLLSPKAEGFLEEMAEKAQRLSLQNFGKNIFLFTPMYLGNYCVNKCAYCSYNIENDIHRKKLNLDEIEKEAKAIAATGLKHILILTGESIKETPVEYMAESVKVLKKYFQSVSIEVYPLKEEEYKQLVQAGVDGFTMFQETYNEEIYDRVHLAGPKKIYKFRLDAPERACKAGLRTVNIGALLGLNEWRRESFVTGLHANYLQHNYSEVEISVSPPRIRPHVGVFEEVKEVTDKNLVQYMLALRIFMPRTGITISTRETPELRRNLIGLGVTKMSAGVTTEVGGHSSDTELDKGDGQFETSDKRTVEEVKKDIISKGYYPVVKDWMQV